MKTTTAVAALSLVVATGCSRKGAGGPARIPVTVARAEQRAVPYEIIATGTVEPRQTVSVQSQVTGVLTQVAFREGDDVAAGQVLFQIDARPFQAALDQARAMLARDQAQAQSAVLDAQRYAELRSEERRVGKECRSRGSTYNEEKEKGKKRNLRGMIDLARTRMMANTQIASYL